MGPRALELCSGEEHSQDTPNHSSLPLHHAPSQLRKRSLIQKEVLCGFHGYLIISGGWRCFGKLSSSDEWQCILGRLSHYLSPSSLLGLALYENFWLFWGMPILNNHPIGVLVVVCWTLLTVLLGRSVQNLWQSALGQFWTWGGRPWLNNLDF